MLTQVGAFCAPGPNPHLAPGVWEVPEGLQLANNLAARSPGEAKGGDTKSKIEEGLCITPCIYTLFGPAKDRGGFLKGLRHMPPTPFFI